MRSARRVIFYGFLLWFVTLVISMALFPLKRSWPVLFDSIMPVALTIVTVVFASLYFRRGEDRSLKEGARLGAVWLAINLLLDLPLFSYGPMRMSLRDYFADIGLTYLIIPAITLGLAFQMTMNQRARYDTGNPQ